MNASLAHWLNAYKAEFELMCIQLLSGSAKLAVRHSLMVLYGARNDLNAHTRHEVEALLITDGETVHALLELADARGAAQVQFCDARLRRLRQRHTRIVRQLHHVLAAPDGR